MEPRARAIRPQVELDDTPGGEDGEIRAQWLDLMRRRLPEAARAHPEWPIRLDHCFGRVILDAVAGRPWREVVASPAWRHLNAEQLRAAIALGEALVTGQADCDTLNEQSLRLRGKRSAS